MRITGGKARGIPLKTTTLKTLRPATDYMREAVFSSLGDLIKKNQILDLFAGTGAYGLEALSRGARHATFIEKNAQAVALIKHNWEAVAKSMQAVGENVSILKEDVFRWAIDRPKSFDIIFLDPPYAFCHEAHYQTWIKGLPQWLHPTGRLVIEMPGNLPPPEIASLRVIKKIGKKGKQEPTAYIYGFTNPPVD